MIDEHAPSVVEPGAADDGRRVDDASSAPRPAKDIAAEVRLIEATRNSAARAADALARGYARSTGREADRLAVADGFLLGAAATGSFMRALQSSLLGQPALSTRRGRTFAKRSWLERIATPGLTVTLSGTATKMLPPASAEGASVLYSDADAPAILLNLALSERFVRGRKPTVVASREIVSAVELALGPLIELGLATVVAGSLEEACDLVGRAPESDVVAIASPSARKTLRAAMPLGRSLEGFCSGAPSVIAIVPFLYARDELVSLANHVVSEVVASPGPTNGVALIVARGWLQRAVFVDILRDAFLERKPHASAERTRQRLGELGKLRKENATDLDSPSPWPVIDTETRLASDYQELRLVTVLEAPSDDPKTFLDDANRIFGDLVQVFEEVFEERSIDLLSLFAHPMLLERPAFVAQLAAWKERVDVPVLGIGTRASLAWTLGGPPIGPRNVAIQNAWRIEQPTRVIIEGPLRGRVQSGAGALARRARFEAAPSLGRAMILGARSFSETIRDRLSAC